MNTDNSKAIELWNSKWAPETHNTEYASKRIKSAQSAKLTPVKIDDVDLYGYFQGSHGRYETFLDYCPCGDFHRSKLPCKHIYRLAIELGVLNINAVHNDNAIPVPKGERVTLDETIDIIEGLSETAQHTLYNIAKCSTSSEPSYLISLCTEIEELLNSGIIVNMAPEEYVINFGNKGDIIAFLDSEGIPYIKSAKKNALEELCLQTVPEKTEAKFGKSIYVGIPKRFSARKIHYYLHRKYDTLFYFDDSPHEISLLDTVLPDDDVTEQLIKRGYYSTDKPKTNIDKCQECSIKISFE